MAWGDDAFDSADEFLEWMLGEDWDGDYSDIDGIGLHYDDASETWSITVDAEGYEYDTGGIFDGELPDWVWDDLYYEADVYDWEWEVEYG